MRPLHEIIPDQFARKEIARYVFAERIVYFVFGSIFGVLLTSFVIWVVSL
jgi:ABC-type antimicrobial peptide transport system permease subunit